MNGWSKFFHEQNVRFGDAPGAETRQRWTLDLEAPPDTWALLSARASCREFDDRKPSLDELKTIAALALASPTKSDLQQRDIVLVQAEDQLGRLKRCLASQAWTAGAPVLAVFCANHRRQRRLHEMRGHSFENDHLDAFFNASIDAGIALSTFVIAAEAAGLGTCPISAIRNESAAVSEILNLPGYVFPIAGLAVGYPAKAAEPSLRLPLSATVHTDRFSDEEEAAAIEAYDARRAASQPYAQQRREDVFGRAEAYTWSEDKARQYHLPERVDFGAFIRAKGFRLD
jgi:nitroreductase